MQSALSLFCGVAPAHGAALDAWREYDEQPLEDLCLPAILERRGCARSSKKDSPLRLTLSISM